MRFLSYGLLALAVLNGGELKAQTRPTVSFRGVSWIVGSGYGGSSEGRGGFAGGIGLQHKSTALRVVAGHAGQGEVEPGLSTIVAEFEPKIQVEGGPAIGVRLGAGAHHMDVRNRHRVMDACGQDNGCMFEAPGFAQGWSRTIEISAVMAGRITRELSVAAALGLNKLSAGANDGERIGTVNVGVEYRFR